MRPEILVGVERRRRWTEEQKLRILAEVGVEGAGVSDVARRHDLARQHLYQWRSCFRRRLPVVDPGVRFLPVEHADDESAAPGTDQVEIVLRNGRMIRIAGNPAEAALARIIRIAETA